MRALAASFAVIVFGLSLASSAVAAPQTGTLSEVGAGQITDSVPQTDPMVLGTSPAAAMANIYQVTASALASSATDDSTSMSEAGNTMGVSVLAVLAHTQAYLLGG